MLSVRTNGLPMTIAGSFEQFSYSAAVCDIRTVCDPVQLNAVHHSKLDVYINLFFFW